MAPGAYDAIQLRGKGSGQLYIHGAGAGTTVSGLDLAGVVGVTVERLRVLGPVMVRSLPTDRSIGSKEVNLRSLEITAPNATCVTIRQDADRVTLDGSWIHDCYTAIAGPVDSASSNRISIRNNLIEDLTADGLQFGSWSTVRIERNVIRHIADPADVIHNDAIQFVGAISDVVIDSNQIYDSQDQLLLLDMALGSIDDVTVKNNLMYQAGAWAVQSSGATNVRFLGNTVWGARWGALLLRRGKSKLGPSPEAPTDTVVVDNILSTYSEIEGARAGTRLGNLVGTCQSGPMPGLQCDADPLFASADTGNFTLSLESPARAVGRPWPGLTVDIRRHSRSRRTFAGAIN